MAAKDISAQVAGWVAGEIGKQCFGENFGFAVAWGPVPVPVPGGQVIAAGWQLLLTTLNPELGGGHLYHLGALGLTRPLEADVRRETGEGMRKLRDLARSKLAGANGKPPAALRG